MNLNDLKIYRTIYECQSINRTAIKLGYAQSNITARLKNLEEMFNTQLFVRSAHGVTPTDMGEKFYEMTTSIIGEIEKFQSQVAQNKPKLLISEALLYDFSTTNTQFDTSKYDITVAKTSDLNSMAQQNLYNVVISFHQLTSKNYRLSKNDCLKACYMANNKNLNILFNSDESCPFRQQTLRDFPIDDYSYQEIDSLAAIITLVQNGQGVALLPSYLQQQLHAKIVKDKSVDIPYYIYVKSDRY